MFSRGDMNARMGVVVTRRSVQMNGFVAFAESAPRYEEIVRRVLRVILCRYRIKFLQENGYFILRFLADDVMNNLGEVMTRVVRRLK